MRGNRSGIETAAGRNPSLRCIYPPRERAAAAHGDTQPVMILQVARQGLADIPVIIGHGNDGDASIANG